MDELLKLASKAGLSDEQGKDTLGGLLSLLQNTLKGDDFAKISESVPGAESLASETNTKAAGASGNGTAGLMQSAMGMFGGASSGAGSASSGAQQAGGGSASALESIPQLLAFLGTLGIDSKKIMTYFPMAIQFLEQTGGVNLSSVLGTTAAGGQGGSSSGSGTQPTGGGFGQQASSFLGAFGKK